MKRWEIYLDIIMELLVILAGALLLIFVLPKTLAFLWPFVAGWIISMIAHPVIEYLEKKVAKDNWFCDTNCRCYNSYHFSFVFCSERNCTAGHRICTIYAGYQTGNYETGNYFPEEDRTFFKYFTTFLWKTV